MIIQIQEINIVDWYISYLFYSYQTKFFQVLILDFFHTKPGWGKRAVGAVNNTFEGLVFFSIAVFTQAFSRLSREDRSEYGKVADILCLIYIVLRVVNITFKY